MNKVSQVVLLFNMGTLSYPLGCLAQQEGSLGKVVATLYNNTESVKNAENSGWS
jgi:hypothetical protein